MECRLFQLGYRPIELTIEYLHSFRSMTTKAMWIVDPQIFLGLAILTGP